MAKDKKRSRKVLSKVENEQRGQSDVGYCSMKIADLRV